VAGRAEAALRRRNVAVRTGSPVREVEAGTVLLSDDQLPADAVVWATGAAPHPWLAASGLPTDEAGFILVEDTLQLSGRTDVFAAGDCAALVDRALPRAGVHAVRQAPVLGHNLAATTTGRPLRRYHPQDDFLTLMNLGDGTALGTKWGRVVEGRWVQLLKDRIDRRFVRSLRI
jgi:selenide,water dikinase